MLRIFKVDMKDKINDINGVTTSSFLLALNEFDNATESFESIFASSSCQLGYIVIIKLTCIYIFFKCYSIFISVISHRVVFFNGDKYFLAKIFFRVITSLHLSKYTEFTDSLVTFHINCIHTTDNSYYLLP